MRDKKLNKHRSGFTLVEVMTAVFLGTVIIMAAYWVYQMSYKSYQKSTKSAGLTQNARITMERFTREIRQSQGIVTTLPASQADAVSEIQFQDGHVIGGPTASPSGLPTNSPSTTPTSTPTSSPILSPSPSNTAVPTTSEAPPIEQPLRIAASSPSPLPASPTPTIAISPSPSPFISPSETTSATPTLPPAPTSSPSSAIYPQPGAIQYITYYLSGTDLHRRLTYYFCPSASGTWVSYNAVCSAPDPLTPANNPYRDDILAQNVTSLKFWGITVITMDMTVSDTQSTYYFETKAYARNV